MSKYFGNFSCVEDIKKEFSFRDENHESTNDFELNEDEVLIASYGGRSYEGAAFVIFQRDGKYYESHASHCSCNGLEGQWSPEETTMEALVWRFDNMSQDAIEGLKDEHGDEFYDALRILIQFEIFEKIVLLS